MDKLSEMAARIMAELPPDLRELVEEHGRRLTKLVQETPWEKWDKIVAPALKAACKEYDRASIEHLTQEWGKRDGKA